MSGWYGHVPIRARTRRCVLVTSTVPTVLVPCAETASHRTRPHDAARTAPQLDRAVACRAMLPARFAPVLDELAPLVARFRERGHRLYLVGGSVRDLLVQHDRQDFDLDLTTDAHPAEIKACLAGWADALWTQGERFGTIGAHKHDTLGSTRVYEITTFRAEAYTDDSRKPHVVFADHIDSDLSRRDFTVNAMALELSVDSGVPVLIDPFGGAADLASRTLRTPAAPEISFGDDPLRMLRAARFIAGYQLDPTEELTAAVTAMAGRLEIVSPERIRDEFDKLITVDHPSAGLWFLVETGLADQFLPELPAMRLEHDPIHRHKDVLTHTIAVVENVRASHRAGRVRLPPDAAGGAVPRHRQAEDPRLPGGQGHDVPPPRRGRRPHDAQADDGDAVLERRHRQGVRARGVAPALPHLCHGVVGFRRAAVRARRRRVVGGTQRADAMRLHHAQREARRRGCRGGWTSSRNASSS